jgi:hypothetical protein
LPEIINALPTLDGPDMKYCTVVVLVTPSFTHLIEEDDFIGGALRRLFKPEMINSDPNDEKRTFVKIVAAVVDRVSADITAFYMEPLLQKGAEGISILIRRHDAGTESFDTTAASDRAVAFGDFTESPRVLSLNWNITQPVKGQLTRWRTTKATADLPLAQTMFINGRTSTMFTSSWYIQKDLVANRFPGTSEPQNVSVNLNLPHIQTGRSKFFLKPLTIPRRVAAATGNVVRQIYLDGSGFRPADLPDNTMPASQELEKAVTSWLDFTGGPPTQVAVWAMIVPGNSKGSSFYKCRAESAEGPQGPGDVNLSSSEAVDWEKTWKSGGAGSTSGVTSQDFVLHRVLSGGGGWGLKQGLISLDPEVSFRPDRRAVIEGNQIENSDSQHDAWRDLVRPGDVIQFFAVPTRLDVGSNMRRSLSNSDNQIDHPRGIAICFGAIPSTFDAIPESGEDIRARTANGPNVILCVDLFSAKSEKGVGLTLVEEPDPTMSVQNVKIRETKIDAPYSNIMTYIKLNGQAAEQHASIQAKHAEFETRRLERIKEHEKKQEGGKKHGKPFPQWRSSFRSSGGSRSS